jgi:hypothetical protein
MLVRAHVSHTFYCVNILVRLPLKPTRIYALPRIYINYSRKLNLNGEYRYRIYKI